MIAGIQADDLTGACDTGAAFAVRGLETVVLLPGAPVPSPPPAVVVLDTESRGLALAAAREGARAATAALAATGPEALYKKVDSTLRGQVAAELAGALEGAGLAQALLAPAFPAQGRTVVDGILRVDGRSADEGPLARDPGFPRTGASVLGLVGAGGPHPTAALPLATVRRGAAAIRARLTPDVRVLVADAETDADLAALAEGAAGLPILLAGSAGLAGALAARVPARPGSGGGTAPKRPLLVVAGSAHPITRAQIERLRGAAGDAAGVVAPPAGVGSDEPAGRAAMAARLAAAALERVERDRPGVLLLVGGDTAAATCRALLASGLRLAGEIERGLAVGALLDGPFQGLAVITKAGGFGDTDALVRVWQACV